MFMDFVMMLSLMIILMLIKNPMQMLMAVMMFMMIIILKLFLNSTDYWTMFIMILSFLVGLFLMFMYVVSFYKGETSDTYSDIFFVKNFFFLVLLTIFTIYFSELLFHCSNSASSLSSFSWYEKWIQEKSEIMIFFLMAFFFLIVMMFYMMKKTKKNMKSSV